MLSQTLTAAKGNKEERSFYAMCLLCIKEAHSSSLQGENDLLLIKAWPESLILSQHRQLYTNLFFYQNRY